MSLGVLVLLALLCGAAAEQWVTDGSLSVWDPTAGGTSTVVSLPTTVNAAKATNDWELVDGQKCSSLGGVVMRPVEPADEFILEDLTLVFDLKDQELVGFQVEKPMRVLVLLADNATFGCNQNYAVPRHGLFFRPLPSAGNVWSPPTSWGDVNAVRPACLNPAYTAHFSDGVTVFATESSSDIQGLCFGPLNSSRHFYLRQQSEVSCNTNDYIPDPVVSPVTTSDDDASENDRETRLIVLGALLGVFSISVLALFVIRRVRQQEDHTVTVMHEMQRQRARRWAQTTENPPHILKSQTAFAAELAEERRRAARRDAQKKKVAAEETSLSSSSATSSSSSEAEGGAREQPSAAQNTVNSGGVPPSDDSSNESSNKLSNESSNESSRASTPSSSVSESSMSDNCASSSE